MPKTSKVKKKVSKPKAKVVKAKPKTKNNPKTASKAPIKISKIYFRSVY